MTPRQESDKPSLGFWTTTTSYLGLFAAVGSLCSCMIMTLGGPPALQACLPYFYCLAALVITATALATKAWLAECREGFWCLIFNLVSCYFMACALAMAHVVLGEFA